MMMQFRPQPPCIDSEYISAFVILCTMCKGNMNFECFRILNTVAEEASLEDTIYYLGEALRREQIGLDEYLRTVRQLSRRQYMQRAILRKCRQKAGFAG